MGTDLSLGYVQATGELEHPPAEGSCKETSVRAPRCRDMASNAHELKLEHDFNVINISSLLGKALLERALRRLPKVCDLTDPAACKFFDLNVGKAPGEGALLTTLMDQLSAFMHKRIVWDSSVGCGTDIACQLLQARLREDFEQRGLDCAGAYSPFWRKEEFRTCLHSHFAAKPMSILEGTYLGCEKPAT